MKKPEPKILSVDDVTALRQAVIDAVDELEAIGFTYWDGSIIIGEFFDKATDIIYGPDLDKWIAQEEEKYYGKR